MTISEKVAYLKGLAEGLGVGADESKEGKLLKEMLGVLEEIGLSIEDLESNTAELGEEIDALSDDLGDVEDLVYDDDDEDEDEDFECPCDGDDDFFEVACPSCGADLVIDEDVIAAGSIQCPQCHEKFAVNCDEDEDDEGDGPCCGRGKGGCHKNQSGEQEEE